MVTSIVMLAVGLVWLPLQRKDRRMATIDYDGKKVILAPAQLILDSGMNVFGLQLFMESIDKVPTEVPTAFAFEHRGVRFVVDRDPDHDVDGKGQES